MMKFIEKRFDKIRRSCWKMIDRDYPEIKTKYDMSFDLVRKTVKELHGNKSILVLDAGCGHKSGISFDDSLLPITFIGSDIVWADVKNNRNVDWKICSDLEHIPLKDKSIDILFCNMVLEHICEPSIFWRECGRVIKDGGFMVFSTPCAFNIVVIVNKFIPNYLSKKLGALLTGQNENDIFPTVYKSNSRGVIKRFCEENGFIISDLIMYQPPPYAFVFSKTVCRIMLNYYRLINRFECLSFLRGIIIGRFQKIAVSAENPKEIIT